jgi:hypothetical protein
LESGAFYITKGQRTKPESSACFIMLLPARTIHIKEAMITRGDGLVESRLYA